MTDLPTDPAAVAKALADPFPVSQLRWLPKVIRDGRALAFPYVSGTDVQNRLDKSVGLAGWRDEYQVLPSGAVVCTLSLCVGGVWIAKSDVGSPSEQPDEHDRVKAAFTDALKRTAVKFGVARYLHYIAPVWCEYDSQRKQIDTSKLPALPSWARPSPPAGDKAAAVVTE